MPSYLIAIIFVEIKDARGGVTHLSPWEQPTLAHGSNPPGGLLTFLRTCLLTCVAARGLHLLFIKNRNRGSEVQRARVKTTPRILPRKNDAIASTTAVRIYAKHISSGVVFWRAWCPSAHQAWGGRSCVACAFFERGIKVQRCRGRPPTSKPTSHPTSQPKARAGEANPCTG